MYVCGECKKECIIEWYHETDSYYSERYYLPQSACCSETVYVVNDDWELGKEADLSEYRQANPIDDYYEDDGEGEDNYYDV